MSSTKAVSPQTTLLQQAQQNTRSNTRADKKDQRDPKLLEAARLFEGQFVREMISQMRKTVPEDGLMPDSMAGKIYREQLDNEYADKWVDNGGIGLADLIYEQMEQKGGSQISLPKTQKGEFLNITPGSKIATKKMIQDFHNLFSSQDASSFLVKPVDNGYSIISRGPLSKNVTVHSPLSGQVLQVGMLEDGRKMVTIRHDQGLVSNLIHSGETRVEKGSLVQAGTIIAELLHKGGQASSRLFFGLRPISKTE